MLRTSLRSVAGPRRQHVCLPCLTRRSGGNVRVRQLHATPALRESGDAPVDASVKSDPVTESSAEVWVVLENNQLSRFAPGTSADIAFAEQVKQSPEEKNNPTPGPKRKPNVNITQKRAARKARKKATAEKRAARLQASATTKDKNAKPPKTAVQKVSQEELSEFLKKQKPKGDGSSTILEQLATAQKADKTTDRTTTRADQESMKNLAFILDSMHKKDTGSLSKEGLTLKRKC